MQSCPQCREVYGTVGIRNLILESIIVKLKPKSQIQKKTERKKHGNNHGGAKRVMQDIGNDRNQFEMTYQHQRQQEQFQQQQQQDQMWQQISQGMQRLRQKYQLEEEAARQHQLVYGHQMSR